MWSLAYAVPLSINQSSCSHMWIQLHSQILGLQQNLFKSVVLIKFIKIQLIDKFMLSGRQIDIINDKI